MSKTAAAHVQAADLSGDLFDYTLRLGDNALILSQRLSELVRNAASVELDIALANFALDQIGQARMLLSYAGEIEGKGRGEDQLAFLRDGWDFRNVLLVELPNGDFAQTMLRFFFYSAFAKLFYEKLAASRDARLAAIAQKALKEVSYHLKHAADWVIRLGDGTPESHARMEHGLREVWPYTAELFKADELDRRMAAAGLGVDPSALKVGWDALVDAMLAEATLARPDDAWAPDGGKRGVHTEHLGYLLAEMQVMQRAYPGMEW